LLIYRLGLMHGTALTVQYDPVEEVLSWQLRARVNTLLWPGYRPARQAVRVGAAPINRPVVVYKWRCRKYGSVVFDCPMLTVPPWLRAEACERGG